MVVKVTSVPSEIVFLQELHFLQSMIGEMEKLPLNCSRTHLKKAPIAFLSP